MDLVSKYLKANRVKLLPKLYVRRLMGWCTRFRDSARLMRMDYET